MADSGKNASQDRTASLEVHPVDIDAYLAEVEAVLRDGDKEYAMQVTDDLRKPMLRTLIDCPSKPDFERVCACPCNIQPATG